MTKKKAVKNHWLFIEGSVAYGGESSPSGQLDGPHTEKSALDKIEQLLVDGTEREMIKVIAGNEVGVNVTLG